MKKLGLLMLCFWLADTIYKIFVLEAPLRMLWFSSAGLGMTAFALLTIILFILVNYLMLKIEKLLRSSYRFITFL